MWNCLPLHKDQTIASGMRDCKWKGQWPYTTYFRQSWSLEMSEHFRMLCGQCALTTSTCSQFHCPKPYARRPYSQCAEVRFSALPEVGFQRKALPARRDWACAATACRTYCGFGCTKIDRQSLREFIDSSAELSSWSGSGIRCLREKAALTECEKLTLETFKQPPPWKTVNGES